VHGRLTEATVFMSTECGVYIIICRKHVLIYGIRHHSVTNEIEEGTLTTSTVLPEGWSITMC